MKKKRTTFSLKKALLDGIIFLSQKKCFNIEIKMTHNNENIFINCLKLSIPHCMIAV